MNNKGKKVFANILNYIHVTFWLSLLSFATVYLTLGILLIPVLTSVFTIGREIIYSVYDTTDSVFGRFFGGLKANLGMMRYFPLQILFCMQGVGVYAGNMAGMKIVSYICTAVMGLILTYIIFVCLCRVHFEQKCDLVTVAVIMIYSLPYMLTVWLVMTLVCLFMGPHLMVISLLIGALVLVLLQGAALNGILRFKQKTAELTEEEERIVGRTEKPQQSGTGI